MSNNYFNNSEKVCQHKAGEQWSDGCCSQSLSAGNDLEVHYQVDLNPTSKQSIKFRGLFSLITIFPWFKQ